MEEEARKYGPFEDSLAHYLSTLIAIRHLAYAYLPAMNASVKATRASIDEELKPFLKPDEPDKVVTSRLNYHRIKKLIRKRKRLVYPTVLHEQAMIIHIYNAFESLVVNLLHSVSAEKPETIAILEKQVSLKDLFKYSTLEDAKEAVLIEEIEGITRKGLDELFTWFKSRCKKLEFCGESWSTFREGNLRRNVIVHNNGFANSTYCTKLAEFNESAAQNVKLGDHLVGDGNYLNSLIESALDIGSTLYIAVLGHMAGATSEEIESSFTDIVFNLIEDEHYTYALRIISVIERVSKNSSRVFLERLTLNKAQCHKWHGDQNRCDLTLSEVNWKETQPLFSFAAETLKNDFSGLEKNMRALKELDQDLPGALSQYPVFKELIMRDDFRAIFRSLYGKNLDDFQAELPMFDLGSKEEKD